MRKRGKRKGFTLMELLIIVAVIAVLVGVSIPIFVSKLEAARKATCDANRTILQHLIIYDMMSEESTANEAYEKYYKENETTYACPSNGIISMTSQGSVVKIHCTKHGATKGENVDLYIELTDVLKELNQNMSGNSNGRYDSTVKNSNYLPEATEKEVLDILNRLNLPEREVKTWSYQKNNNNPMLIWSTVDVNEVTSLNKNIEVPVLRYDENKKRYSVWWTKIEPNKSNGTGTYDVLNISSEYKPEGVDLSNGSLSSAGEIYNMALEEYIKKLK